MPYCAYCGAEIAQLSYAPCPSCGNPTNGAPRPVVKSTNTAMIVLGVVVAVFVVVAIVGILAAIAIPNLLTAMQRSKQKRTMADIRTVVAALEAYATDRNSYPDPARLEESLVPTYLKALPKADGWEKPLVYQCWSTAGAAECDSYGVGSGGKDGLFEHDSFSAYDGAAATTNFNDDVLMVNGAFVRYPQGVQAGN